MIYRPQYTIEENNLKIRKLIEDYSFATLISAQLTGGLMISHVPVVAQFDDRNYLTQISGHIARANPHAKIFDTVPQVVVIFNGPHSYVSPTWYKSGRDVPTWLYTTAHVIGDVKLVSDFRGIVKNLSDLTKKFETETGWKFGLPSDLAEPEQLEKAIVAFDIKVNSVEAKFKLAQSRPVIDQVAVIENLQSRGGIFDSSVAELMKDNLTNVKA